MQKVFPSGGLLNFTGFLEKILHIKMLPNSNKDTK